MLWCFISEVRVQSYMCVSVCSYVYMMYVLIFACISVHIYACKMCLYVTVCTVSMRVCACVDLCASTLVTRDI